MSLARFLRSLLGTDDADNDGDDAADPDEPVAPEPSETLVPAGRSVSSPPLAPLDPGIAERLRGLDSDAALQVFADELSERDDPRGELIALMLTDTASSREAARALRNEHRAHFWGPYARATVKTVDTAEELAGLSPWDAPTVKGWWSKGFLAGLNARLSGDSAPESDPADVERLVSFLVGHWSTARLEHLILHGPMLHGVHERLAEHAPFPTVRHLSIGDFTSDECELSWADQEAWPDLDRLFPNLETLSTTQVFEMGPLPALTSIEIVVAGEGIEGSGRVDWGPPGRMSDLEDAVVQACSAATLLERPDVTKLTRLCVAHDDAGAVLAALEARPDLLAKLRILGLSGCELGGVEAQLVALEPKLTALEELVLPEDGDLDYEPIEHAFGDRVSTDYRSPNYFEAIWE